MAKNYTNVNKNKNMEDSSYSSYADVERTKIPTIKILLIRMDMIRQTDINLIEKAKRGIRREVTEET